MHWLRKLLSKVRNLNVCRDAFAQSRLEFEQLKEQVAEQVAQCRRVRIRRIVEDVSRVNRKDLRDHWNMLKTAATTPLPPYSEFLHLDMARTLTRKNTDECLSNPSKESVREELKNNKVTREHVAQQVSAWIRDTKTKLSEALGYDQLALDKEAAFVHPVDRVTAWFSCTRCRRLTGPFKDDNALTFADVCAHRCLGKNKKQRLKGAWKVEEFKADQKAITAAKELLRVSHLKERNATQMQLDGFGCSFLCTACKNPIVMDASSVIGHCKRHETITLELVTSEHPLNISRPLITPIEHGLAAKLKGFSRSGCKQRHRQAFGCRHCPKVGTFTFNGLRSHVKSKYV
ncbi:hypothetical protein JB92DRAFT_2734536 [Gautieria morchelliformis]|nr:hypothetical protein JB92DRAFT_2734536 [Gautieria morchelliformis]